MTVAIPSRGDFTSPTETIVYPKAGSRADERGRSQFTAFWLDDYLPPDGVRGQVFHTSLIDFIARHEAQGKTVRVVGERP
ncbi:hypothetical protein [Actinoplanes sp. NPDC051494]|uniref:hypothetical protein n=1 Tax=Actinoplanes sp. NPDC051494 TaxID=3363907 RepID=UPI0037B2891C